MKIAELSRQGRPLTRSAAWLCVMTNQLATPGLGSIVAGRVAAGLIQLAIAVAGFVLLMAWFFHLFKSVSWADDLAEAMHPYAWMGELGLLLFVVSWILALASSIAILKEAKRKNISDVPPQI